MILQIFKYKIIFLVLLLNANQLKAQFVNIPDTAFRNYLVSIGLSTCMQGDSLDTTCTALQNVTNINCSTLNIQSIEGIKYFI